MSAVRENGDDDDSDDDSYDDEEEDCEKEAVCSTEATVTALRGGKFELIFAHPEALLFMRTGTKPKVRIL